MLDIKFLESKGVFFYQIDVEKLRERMNILKYHLGCNYKELLSIIVKLQWNKRC